MSSSRQSPLSNVPVGRLVASAKKPRPAVPVPASASEVPAATRNEADLLLILGVGGALWLAVLAGVGFLWMGSGDPASAPPPETLAVAELVAMPTPEPDHAV